MSFRLLGVQLQKAPFDHLVGTSPLACLASDAVDWFENDAPWRLTTTEFYEQFEFSLLDIELPKSARGLVKQTTIRGFRDQISRYFRTPLSERVDVTAHKLTPGQTIRIHNDFLAHGETHRLLLQLTPSWDAACGGFLMLFSGPEPESVAEVIAPVGGSVQAFEISETSYHAVSTVYRRARYTAVYSFYGALR